MSIISISVIIIIPLVMLLVTLYMKPFQIAFHFLALLCVYSVGIVLALAVIQTNSNGTTFTTNVHTILLNPWLLYPGAYLGLYIPYRIMLDMSQFKACNCKK
ncbi:hypothetical protein [Paenibacillus sp. 481]|uniref:hypothetical protein n=1 Tax=Paenibacillus sp. 481 TaxID=2835869 RepID=UPI001E49CA6A|nr:hypothetical protein [Paenibacillus sp. 481]UHA72807.1 hypothetical protein KIK04_19590 [Paenibacillus sp. 481]